QIRKLEQQKTNAELQALKAQLNPHFLFNSLNNIYSLALYEDKKTPEALLQLSQCLRYVLYDCKTPQIELQKELNFLKYFMNLQALRSEANLKTNLLIHGQTEGYSLSPLLFLPLLENAYKHAKPNQSGAYFINVNCQIEEDRVTFEIQNSVPVSPPEPTSASGVGIENLKKRLDLLYPKEHLLKLDHNEAQFEVKLKVPLTKSVQNAS
ncbi:MAG: histidine kinase, partial [Bacteroidota bacterium]